jgi:trans-AT polyketide synthase/acyltransferase/oxidoreductase domain-containing protein
MSATDNRSTEGHDVVVFPGQGSQRVRMGADLCERFTTARRVFEESCDAVGEDLTAICFAPDDRLQLTEFTQPCILTMEVAAYRVAVEEFGLDARAFGGHSLGEYSALVAAGAIDLGDAARLVRTRGALMQRAVPAGAGAMAALLLDDIDASGAASIARRAGASIANHNSPGQIVISATTACLEAARDELAAALPELTFVPLKVSAPFHSALMEPVQDEFRAHLERSAPGWRPQLAAAVTSNFTGDFHEPDALVDDLVQQIAGAVRWLDNMRRLRAGARRIYEIGPSATLTKLFGALNQPVTPITTVGEAQLALAGYEPPVQPRRSVPRARRARDSAAADAVPSAAVAAQHLGDPGFRRDQDVELAYVAGGLHMGIASPELVIRLGRARLLGFLGGAHMPLDRLEQDMERVRSALTAGEPWGVNVTHNPYDPLLAGRTVDVLLARGVTRVEASGWETATPDLVRYRLSGLRRGVDGRPKPANRLLAKVARIESARQFLMAPPAAIVRLLRERGQISDGEARLAEFVALADDVCAETATDGHAPSSHAFSLLPGVLRVRDEMVRDGTCPLPVRVGAAGGIGTPEAAAAAFTMGADFILTGSINQCTPQAGTSEIVKDMLARAGIEDFATAPSADRFALGGRVQVLRRGVLFGARADKLYELYLRHGCVDEIAPEERAQIEAQYLRRSFDDVWTQVARDLTRADPEQLRRAGEDGRTRMALLVRWYLTDTVRRACAGEAGDRLNLQIRGGPALGAFNSAVAGSPLEDWRRRHVDEIARYMMDGAARILDERWRRMLTAAAISRAG